MPPDPWGLTDRQRRGMAVFVEHGTNQAVAIELHLSENGAHSLLAAAWVRMGVTNRVLAAVAWTQWMLGVHA